MTLQKLFHIGMKRMIGEVLPNYGRQIDLGGGYNPVPGAVAVDIQDGQDFNMDPTLRYDSDSIDVIHAYHLLEHLDTPVHLLQECQRVLKVGGHMSIVVPYYNSQLQASCWEHKSFFSEESWEQTFCKNCNKFGYKWYFHVHLNVIMGVVEKNMCLVTQLVKVEFPNEYRGYTK